MTQKDFLNRVYCDLIEGYSVELVKGNFKVKVSFSDLDETGEPYYKVEHEGMEIACLNTEAIECFCVRSGYEVL